MDGRAGNIRLIVRRTAVLAAALALVPGVARAQAYQCRVPHGPVSVPAIERDGPVRQVPVTGYTLALTWAPEYCRFRQERAADRRQCSGRSGRFGFVVHGLWPEGRGAAYYALEIAALVFLFRADANAWFRNEWTAEPATSD